jgi:hypothetical protein
MSIISLVWNVVRGWSSFEFTVNVHRVRELICIASKRSFRGIRHNEINKRRFMQAEELAVSAKNERHDICHLSWSYGDPWANVDVRSLPILCISAYTSRVILHQIIMKLNAKHAVDDDRSPLTQRQNEGIKSFKASSQTHESTLRETI